VLFQPPKSIFIAIVLTASHLLAYLIGYKADEKLEPSPVDIEKKITIPSVSTISNKKPTKKESRNLVDFKKDDYKSKVPINFQTTINLKKAVENMHPSQLNHYLSKYFNSDDLVKISDHEGFAQRLIDLYSGEEKNLEKPLFPEGEIAISTTKQYPVERVDFFSIQKNMRLYAHLRLDDSASLLSEVFIKWERADDSKILLFEKKLFDSSLYENWVSIVPQGGWKDGEYHVSFYHFNAQMTKIAGYTYFLNNVWDSPES
jgi:hypothetical protein